MTSRIAQWTLDVQDVALEAAFWLAALGYRWEPRPDGSAKLYPAPGTGDSLSIWLQPGARPAVGKLRAHLDLRPDDGDVDAEVSRLLALGATAVDVGQTPADPFVVLSDPEGNEFCILKREP